jgi:7-carboxy-7-deazaguanine synthase
VRIIEIFHSLQGEGPFTGERTSFVRTARCNLRCAWCDSEYSFGAGREQSLGSILRTVRSHRTRNVCLTGGEPLLQRESLELVRRLSKAGYTTVIETGGSLDITPYLDVPHVVLSVDVKCPSSKMEGHNRWANLPRLRATDVVKYVLADAKDYAYAKRIMNSHPTRAQIVFQPVWGTDAGSLADRVVKEKLDVRFLLQEHKVLWGDVPGK